MVADKVYRAIGLMSGTSLDGVIDVALIETDGQSHVKPLRYYEHPYDISVRDKVRTCFGKRERDETVAQAEALVTDLHIDAIKAFGEDADFIGFHGQTITHDPDAGFTWQLGDGARLAQMCGVDVVYDLRQADMKAGGQGAPLLPLYHKAMMASQELPVAVLNLGGVANITYIGAEEELIAFDCGPANALMDDFIKSRRGLDYDKGGVLACLGSVQNNVVEMFLKDPYFEKKPPKSLDRNQWTMDCVQYASNAENGMATLMEMSVQGVVQAMKHLPETPKHIYAAGGGRHNDYMMDCLNDALNIPVQKIETQGWNGDTTEAEGFAYLAVRSALGLPITLPATTGVKKPQTGGVLARA